MSLIVLQTLVVEIEVVLNDQPLTYVSSEFDEMDPLIPALLLHGRGVTSLRYESVNDDDEVNDSYFGDDSSVKCRALQQTLTLQHFRSRWKHEYLISLQEYHRTTGTNQQKVKVGDVVLVHNDTPHIN